MRIWSWILILLTALGPFSAVLASSETEACADPSVMTPTSRRLTHTAGSLHYHLKAAGLKESPGSVYMNDSNLVRKLESYFYLSASEKNVMGANPLMFAAVQNSLKISRLADQYCTGKTKNMEDEWGDSVRHFLASASLSSQLGRVRAQRFMDAHEAGGAWDLGIQHLHASLTDLKNNQVGITYGIQFHKKRMRFLNQNLSEDQAILGAAEMLRQRKLSSRKGGDPFVECKGLFEKEAEIQNRNQTEPIYDELGIR